MPLHDTQDVDMLRISCATDEPNEELERDDEPNEEFVKVRVKVELSGQFQFGWDEYGSLKAGSCNCYRYPQVMWRSKRASMHVVDRSSKKKSSAMNLATLVEDNESITLLSTLILATAIQHPEEVGRLSDAEGAGLLHALLISSSREGDALVAEGAGLLHALLISSSREGDALVVKLCEELPHLLCNPYAEGNFRGEGPLHLVAVSGKSDLMMKILTVALQKLEHDQLQCLFSQTAEGAFFYQEPMSHFGGTPAAYLAVFGMLDAIKLLDSDISIRNFALNVRCPVSGYMPVHAAVIASRKDIYDYLCDHCGCDEFAQVEHSRVFDLEGLIPLQLACKFGIHTIFKHLLRRRAVKQWSWGPVTSYMLPMRGIDTEGIAGDQHVMELVAEITATHDAQMMLEYSFMNGFIYELFVMKWRRWAVYLWSAYAAVDVCLMALLSLLASPTLLGEYAESFVQSKIPAALTVVLALFNGEEQFRECGTYFWANGKNIQTREEITMAAWQWFGLQAKNWILVPTSLLSCYFLLNADKVEEKIAEPHIRILFSISALLAWVKFFSDFFSPFHRYSVFVVMMEQMVSQDMTLWFAIALPLTFSFTTATNAVSLNAATFNDVDDPSTSWYTSDVDDPSTSWYTSLEDLSLLALIGLDPSISLPTYEDDANATTSNLRRLKSSSSGIAATGTSKYPSDYAQTSALGVFFFGYYAAYMFIVVLMLVNLLIAMLGNTYSSMIASAQLQGRVRFARLVLQLELRAFNTPLGFLPGKAWRNEMVEKFGRLGELRDGLYYLDFRSYSMPNGMTHRGTLGDIFQVEAAHSVDEAGQLARPTPNGMTHRGTLGNIFQVEAAHSVDEAGQLARPTVPDVRERVLKKKNSFCGSAVVTLPSAQASDSRLDQVERKLKTLELQLTTCQRALSSQIQDVKDSLQSELSTTSNLLKRLVDDLPSHKH
eukprot:CAMPEP_0205889230 /NCGR_PEP_ID=MMETSP1083-20121108/20841_1 /ASSEMBLY_ACC=CAM_ASM_000430 /TAXON_ID=97485 /ORGANISM="Prymnesium parvum, Strain Texoma1" /LENGTH=943 /DNA_ID=CAMNT_0053253285 /DNA_START=20 /DNA_END=2853 /DNA_ORIENTATION=+